MCFVENRRNKFEKVDSLYGIEMDLMDTYHNTDILEDEFLFRITYENFCSLNVTAREMRYHLNKTDEYDEILRNGLDHIIRTSTVMIALMKKKKPELCKPRIIRKEINNESNISTAS